jgi:hypothetical protein
VAMGDLRSLLTSHADSACAVDHPAGCRGIERHAAPLGPVHRIGRKGATIQIPGSGGLQSPLHGWPMLTT